MTMRQFNRTPRIRSYSERNSLRFRVDRLEAREGDVLAKQWRIEEREKELAALIEQVNAATALNEATQEALKTAEEQLISREASLMARERACLEREEESRRREAAAAMLDQENATTQVLEAYEWVCKRLSAEPNSVHLCDVAADAENEGHSTFAVYWALSCYMISECTCEDDDDE